MWKSGLWPDESKFDILVGNHGLCVLWTKEKEDLLACYQRSVQKPASLMIWGCISADSMGSLHALEDIMNAERHIKVLEQHMLPSRRHVSQGRPWSFQQNNAKPHTAAITKVWLHSRRVRALNWHAFHLYRTFGASLNEKFVKDDHKHFNSWKPIYQARMGPKSNSKTPETHNLNAQTSSNCFENKRRCYTMANMPPPQLFWDLFQASNLKWADFVHQILTFFFFFFHFFLKSQHFWNSGCNILIMNLFYFEIENMGMVWG